MIQIILNYNCCSTGMPEFDYSIADRTILRLIFSKKILIKNCMSKIWTTLRIAKYFWYFSPKKKKGFRRRFGNESPPNIAAFTTLPLIFSTNWYLQDCLLKCIVSMPTKTLKITFGTDRDELTMFKFYIVKACV